MRLSILAGILAIFVAVACDDDTALISEPGSEESEESDSSSAPEAIVLFDSGQSTTGNNAFIHQDWCDSAAPSGLTEVHPLISTSSTALKDIVPAELADLPVEGPTGIEIRESWENIWLAGSLNNSLSAANVTSNEWWTGADGAGATVSNCTDWTDGSGGGSATYGAPGSTGSAWLFTATTACSVFKNALCIGW